MVTKYRKRIVIDRLTAHLAFDAMLEKAEKLLDMMLYFKFRKAKCDSCMILRYATSSLLLMRRLYA